MDSARDAKRGIFLEERRAPLLKRGRMMIKIAGLVAIVCLTLGSAVKLYLDRRPSAMHRRVDRTAATAMVAMAPSAPAAIAPARRPKAMAVADMPSLPPSVDTAVGKRPAAVPPPVPRAASPTSLRPRVAPKPDPAPTPRSRQLAANQPIAPYRNGTKAVHLTGEALRLALIEDSAITQRANAAALTSPPADRQ